MANENILQVEELGKEFRTPEHTVTVLDGLSFSLRKGETCAILGPSGCGKSTLLGLCAGLDTPTRGRVRLQGTDLGSLDEDGRARLRRDQVGFVFQTFQLIPTLTALENVMVPLELRGEEQARQRAASLLEKVGLSARINHYPAQLSGGEQQRVALARAHVHLPGLLLADEPTGNLDGDTAVRIVDLLFSLNQTTQTALLLVTHDLDLARRCDRVLRLRNGRIEQPASAP